MRALVIALVASGLVWGSREQGAVPSDAPRAPGSHRQVLLPAPRSPEFAVIILPVALRDLMSAVWVENNRHWDELADQNTLTQLLGTGKPTQREYLGCLQGEIARDTLWVRGIVAAAELKQLQFAVSGNCDDVDQSVGTWHTHPYRADPAGRAMKERGLSPMDLATFASARDVVTLVMWDLDSLDAAAKAVDGTVRHPAPLAVR
ncbi:MAG: hypothetical protein ACREMM_01385 [Gemmatimonadales bacterium]